MDAMSHLKQEVIHDSDKIIWKKKQHTIIITNQNCPRVLGILESGRESRAALSNRVFIMIDRFCVIQFNIHW